MNHAAAIALLAILTFACPALAEIAGIARVIDGDTIEIKGQRIRLNCIDAPESKQTCKRDGKERRCGRDATVALHDKIGKKSIRCEGQDEDRYRRIIAMCFIADTDINEWLVLQGWAVAYTRYSHDYVRAEALAKSKRRGVWAGEFVMP